MAFTLKKKVYEGIITRIKAGNSFLHEFAGLSCELEPSRRRRSQVRIIKLLRELTRSIFNALHSASSCQCSKPHDAYLELVPREAVLVPSDHENQVAKDFKFHVVLSSYNDTASDSAPGAVPRVIATQQSVRLDSLYIQAKFDRHPASTLPSSLPLCIYYTEEAT